MASLREAHWGRDIAHEHVHGRLIPDPGCGPLCDPLSLGPHRPALGTATHSCPHVLWEDGAAPKVSEERVI